MNTTTLMCRSSHRRNGVRILPLICVALAGCAAQPKYWSHPLKTTDAFYADRAQCTSMAGYGASSPQVARPPSAAGFGGGFMSGWNMAAAGNQANAQQQIYNDCMMGKGWRLETESGSGKESKGSAKPEQRIAFEAALKSAVPDWEVINVDPAFVAWLDEPDESSGELRTVLIHRAATENDIARVAAFFNDFREVHLTPRESSPPVQVCTTRAGFDCRLAN